MDDPASSEDGAADPAEPLHAAVKQLSLQQNGGSSGAPSPALLSFSDDDDVFDPYITPAEASASNPLYLGIDLSSCLTPRPTDPSFLPSLLSTCLANPYDHCLFPLSPPLISSATSALTLPPLSFPSSTFASSFFAVLPEAITRGLIDPTSSPAALQVARKAFQECYSWYGHCGLVQVVICVPGSSFSASWPPSPGQLAHCLFTATTTHPTISTTIALDHTQDSLHFYHRVLHACDHSSRVTLSLVLSSNLPDQHILSALQGDQLRFVLLSTDCFVSNSKGCPILPRNHRARLTHLLTKCNTVILKPAQAELPQSLVLHQHYLHHLRTTSLPPPSSSPALYHDLLQAPLQPLHDDLENQTYEVFERDPVKYQLYQQAIALALKDRRGQGKVRVWVVGAGRGPLVDAVIAASQQEGVDVQLTALEKNVHALYTLQWLQSTRWQSIPVRVIHANILHYVPEASDRCDVMVSELLGSFGDNELAPECLDAACKWLSEGGVCIPERSVGWMRLVRNEVVTGQLMGGGGVGGKAGKEAGYVIDLHACERVSAEEGRVCFVFAHPARADDEEQLVAQEEAREDRRLRRAQGTQLAMDSDEEAAYLDYTRPAPSTTSLPSSSLNSRSRLLSFTIPSRSDSSSPFPTLITGLACYFHARLYRYVLLSSYPPTASPGMTSWFSLYLPLRTPMWAAEGSEVRVQLWRAMGEAKVWYEWQVEVWAHGVLHGSTHIHNAGGAAAPIHL